MSHFAFFFHSYDFQDEMRTIGKELLQYPFSRRFWENMFACLSSANKWIEMVLL